MRTILIYSNGENEWMSTFSSSAKQSFFLVALYQKIPAERPNDFFNYKFVKTNENAYSTQRKISLNRERDPVYYTVVTTVSIRTTYNF
mmetsp:Transcript_21291/g.24632  ORF Transcript_21291/g.24632 Transcript_21291/m.24632 type:complete len:88 (+) Transcript_21291:46-309(+)